MDDFHAIYMFSIGDATLHNQNLETTPNELWAGAVPQPAFRCDSDPSENFIFTPTFQPRSLTLRKSGCG